MKIIHFTTPLSWRGGEQQVAYLIEGLIGKGVDQTIVCTKHSEVEAYFSKSKIPLMCISKSISVSLTAAIQFATYCKKVKPDLVHLHDSKAHSIAILSAALFANKTPFVLSRKVDFPIGKNFFSRYKYNHPSIKKIVCVSRKISEILTPDLADTSKLTVVYDGIDLTKFSKKSAGYLRNKYHLNDSQLLIGNVAAIAPHKDYFTFVDTVYLLSLLIPDARYFIIGDGPERKKIEEYILLKKLDKKIFLTGFIKNIQDVLPELDLLLYTSKTEGLGSTILDAYSCHVPVVATGAGGIPEIVIHEKTGLLSPPQNSESLASNVMRMLEDSFLREKLTGNAFQFVKGFSKESNAEKVYELYSSIIKSF